MPPLRHVLRMLPAELRPPTSANDHLVLPLRDAVAACNQLTYAPGQQVADVAAPLLGALRTEYLAGQDLLHAVVSAVPASLANSVAACQLHSSNSLPNMADQQAWAQGACVPRANGHACWVGLAHAVL